MTKYYGIMPWDIGKMTLFQWQIYSEKIEVIHRVFHAQPKAGKGSKENAGNRFEYNKENHEELKALAKRKKIKLPSKGME